MSMCRRLIRSIRIYVYWIRSCDFYEILNSDLKCVFRRAILGSVERMIAILTENFAGKWPFWMSPRQVMVVPVGPHVNAYAQEVQDTLRKSGYCCDADTDDGNTMNKKVRNAQIAQYNYILGE